MAALIVQSGKHRGKKLVLPQKDVIVGRDDDCQIRLATKEISRHHCILKQSSGGITVTDLGSQNGTLVNDALISEETVLNAGDILTIGPITFQVAGEKKSPEKAAAPETTTESATDNDIASWLNQDVTDDGATSAETTIIKKRSEVPDADVPDTDVPDAEVPDAAVPKPAAAPTPESEPVTAATSQDSTAVPPASKRNFNSIAEEGADIIRRHLEMIRDKE